jgi:hypothetical protein
MPIQKFCLLYGTAHLKGRYLDSFVIIAAQMLAVTRGYLLEGMTTIPEKSAQ